MKGTIQRTEIERPFLPAKGFNANLVQFLNFYRRIMLLLITCMSAIYGHGRAPKTVLHARKIIIYEGLSHIYDTNSPRSRNIVNIRSVSA